MRPTASPNTALVFWLLSTCFLIWLMIMLGGATRLTHSGLSIVEWKPVTGIIPPLTQEAWAQAFDAYKQFPEYQLVNQGMTLSAFQFIYGMEYAHRLLGRLMGLWFAVPLALFWVRGRLSSALKKRALLALALGAAQGVMGWYMVKSGLVKDPNVSPYRLTAHLLLAIGLYSLLLWTAFDLLLPSEKQQPEPSFIKRSSSWCCGAIALTILYGGLVAGLKAGLIYNTFPLMEGQFIPDEWSFYHPLWVNFLENPALVQWIHRWLALSTFAIISITAWKIWTLSPNPTTRNAALLWGAAALLQVTLGIFTLLLHVPVTLGTLHQGTAVILLSLGLYVAHLGRLSRIRAAQSAQNRTIFNNLP
jgi:cytochrome c oxidase assembly protein subunit 15